MASTLVGPPGNHDEDSVTPPIRPLRPTTPIPAPRRPSRSRWRSLLIVAVATSLVALLGCSGDDGSSALPDATLVSLADGVETRTDALAPEGTPLVVNVWASWCVPCIEEMPAFDEVHQAMGDRVAIVGVTDDREASARRLAEETDVSYPLLRDPDRTLLPDLGVVQLPATVFVAPDGTIVERHQGAMTADELTTTIERLWGTT